MLLASLPALMNAGSLLTSFGPWILTGVAVIIFIESGVLFPFLPGDSLLVTAAILRGDLHVHLGVLGAIAIAAAFAGDQVGFFLGRRFGRRLFKPQARILTTARLEEAEAFFGKHGPLALVLGRFVPIVRTYVPLAAGTARMPYSHFLRWNILGAAGWVVAMLAVGALLGGIPGIAHSIDLIMIVIVALSVLPMVLKWMSRRRAARRVPVAA